LSTIKIKAQATTPKGNSFRAQFYLWTVCWQRPRLPLYARYLGTGGRPTADFRFEVVKIRACASILWKPTASFPRTRGRMRFLCFADARGTAKWTAWALACARLIC